MDEEKIITSPIKAIRAKCIDCMCGQVLEVKLCTCIDCALYPFRMGKNPYRKPMSEEQRQAAGERLRKRLEEAQDSQSC